MLDIADKYTDILNTKLYNIWYEPKYIYYFCSPHRYVYETDIKGDWNGRNFVSINSKGELIGFISYSLCRTANYADGFGAVNFSNDPKDKYTFGRDLRQVIDDIFMKFNTNRLEFTVVIGNPIEKTYDKLSAKYGGKVTGIKHSVVKLMDERVVDKKYYEIMREDYLKARNSVHKNNNCK